MTSKHAAMIDTCMGRTACQAVSECGPNGQKQEIVLIFLLFFFLFLLFLLLLLLLFLLFLLLLLLLLFLLSLLRPPPHWRAERQP